jgi:hypothetical protein
LFLVLLVSLVAIAILILLATIVAIQGGPRAKEVVGEQSTGRRPDLLPLCGIFLLLLGLFFLLCWGVLAL